MAQPLALRPRPSMPPLSISVRVREGLVESWVARGIERLSRHPGVVSLSVERSRAPEAPLFGCWRQRVSLSDRVATRPAQLQIILGEGVPPSQRADFEFGVWLFSYGEPSRPATGYFREVAREEAVTQLGLYSLDPDGMCRLIERHVAATIPGRNYPANSAILDVAEAMLERRLWDLWESGRRPQTSESMRPSFAVRPPGAFELLRFTATQALRSVRLRLEARGRSSAWLVCEKRGAEWQEIEAGTEIADPIAVDGPDGRPYLFAEEIPADTRKGRLAAMELDADGRWTRPRVIAEIATHMSYPFVFEHQGQWWMIPETALEGEVSLWRATSFPYEWRRERRLIEGRWVDSTPFLLDGIWYLFTTSFEPSLETYLYWSDSLEGEWRYHPANPISTDVRGARGAGPIFERNGKWIRPGQDCSVRYGWAMTLHEIQRISPDEYVERPVERILPDWYPGIRATHTISFTRSGREFRDASRFIGA